MKLTASFLLAAALVCSLTAPLRLDGAQQVPPAGQQAPPTAAGRGGAPVQGAEPDIPVLAKFDRNSDRRLDYTERTAAREYLAAHPELRRPVRVGARSTRVGTPGPKLGPKDVRTYPASVPLYDSAALRTIFLEFEHADWEQELAAFYHTDVQVHATVTVDGKVYRDVGVAFRGNNSFTAVPEGPQAAAVAVDRLRPQPVAARSPVAQLAELQPGSDVHEVGALSGCRPRLHSRGQGQLRPRRDQCESWGIYVNQQTFSREFLQENFKTTRGTRWKSPNNSTGGGFSYLGDDIELFRRWYEMKGADDPAAWQALVRATRVLKNTPIDQLPATLPAVMDVDEVLRYLALDVALVNNDGYWRDGSDFNLYLNEKGRFLVTLHDANEGFRTGGRTGGAGQPEPLTALDDPNKALRQRLLAVPAWRQTYLKYVGDIAEKWLDWNRLGPLVAKYEKLIAEDVAKDTRKLDSTEAFAIGLHGPSDGTTPAATTIRGFADQRRAALLSHPDIVKARGKSSGAR